MGLALFDLDHTLLDGDCDQMWGDFLAQNNLVNAQQYQSQKNQFYQDYLDGQLDMQAFLSFCAATLASFEPNELQQLGQEFAQYYLRPSLRQQGIDVLYTHREQGDSVLVITATNEFLASLAVESLNVDHLIASELEKSKGQFTGKPQGIPCYQSGKIERLNHWLQHQPFDLSQTTFYSDSHNDLPLLKLVAHPVVVHPDQTLLNYALNQNWPRVYWR